MNDIRDIHGPILHHVEAWWPYLVIGAGMLLLALVVRRLARTRATTPAERALRALEAARAEHDPERFSTRVSDSIRVYVEGAFGVHAPRRTTDELLADLMTDGSAVAAHREELGSFLGYCDLAKYARWSLSEPDRAGMLASAERFVRVTAGGAA
jgi:hypothetical protein